jgi:hypothetical protein
MGFEDISNIRFNKFSARAGISAQISILKSNSRAAQLSGIFEVAGIVAGGLDARAQLQKTSVLGPTTVSSSGLPMSPIPAKAKTLTVFGNPT